MSGKMEASSKSKLQKQLFLKMFFSRGLIVKISLAIAIIFVVVALLADPINTFLLHTWRGHRYFSRTDRRVF